MKQMMLIFALLGVTACGGELPKLKGNVIDDGAVLDRDYEQQLQQTLAAHQRQYGQQVVVVTLYSLSGSSIDEMAKSLSRGWKIGQGHDNQGVLMLIAPHDSQMRIEVGIGLQQQLDAARTQAIMQQKMLPAFAEGDMEKGVQQGVDAILEAIMPKEAE